MVNSSIYNRLFESASTSQKGGAFSVKKNLLPLLKEKQGFLILVFANYFFCFRIFSRYSNQNFNY